MTVPSEQSSIQYDADGVSVSFPVPFRFIQDQHLRVTLLHAGVETVLVLGADYSVSGANDPAGGSVTTTVAYPLGDSLTIERIVPITQETHYQRNDPFPERAHEQALDKLTMICQQIASVFGMTPGSRLRALLLGAADKDGSGAYRANGNRIANLGDPQASRDAVHRQWVDARISEAAIDGAGEFVVERLADTIDADNGANMVGFRQPGGVEQSVYSVLHRGFLAPEQFYLASDGDNWAPAFQRCADAAENYNLAVITLTPGKHYILDDQVVIKHKSVWNCYGATMTMRSNPMLRGGFIRAQGTGTTIGTGWTDRDQIIINGLTAVIGDGVLGVNVFNTTCSHGVVFRDCVAVGSRWALPSDPKPQGGRGYTCHSRTRRARFINCRAYDCDIGFHVMDKADTDYSATPNLVPNFVAGATTVGTVSSHWLSVGDIVQCERYTGNWAALNGNQYEVIDVTETTFTLNVDSSTFGPHDGLGRISRADTGLFRDYSIVFDECDAELCAIQALVFEQVQQSQNVTEPRRITFTGRIKNCGYAHPDDQGVITLSGVPGLSLDVHIYQDAGHPVGSVIRGATAQSEIKVRGYVHTCDIAVNHAPASAGSANLDTGSVLHPEGTSRNNNYNISLEGDSLNFLVWTPSNQVGMTDGQNYTWANRYLLDYGFRTSGAVLVHPRAQHITNHFTLRNMRDGQTTLLSASGVDSTTFNFRESSGTALFRAVTGAGLPLGDIRYTSGNARWLITSGGATYLAATPTTLQPGADGSYNLGTGALRYGTVYATTGAINTSDGREKTSVSPITSNEIAAARALAGEIGTYQWLSAIASKGTELARTHVGLTVQRAIQIMESHGLDPFKYGFICFDAWEESIEDMGEGNSIVRPAGDRYSFRMDELMAFMVRGLSAHLDSLSARLDALDPSS